MCESRKSLRVIGEREQRANLLREFIEDMTAPEVCFGRALRAIIVRDASNSSQKIASQ